MARIAVSKNWINRELENNLPAEVILQACREIGYRFRQRTLNPAQHVYLLIFQLLAMTSYRGLRTKAGLQVTRQALAQARKRLPLELMLRLVKTLWQRISDSTQATLWRGHRIVLLDGTCFRVDDTLELRQRYGKASNARGVSSGCPLVRLLAAVDYSTGMIYKVIAMPYAQQEAKAMMRALRHLNAGDMIVADRGLISFAHAALMLKEGLCFCIRLPRQFVVKSQGRGARVKLRGLGRQDMLVQWRKCGRPTWMSQRRFTSLPETLILRQVAYRLHRKGFRVTWAYLITDRLDPKLYPAQELIELYDKRWQVEVNFRDLKRSLNMHHLSSRNVQGIRKELAAMVILYNLIRLTILRSSRTQNVSPDRISYKDAMDWLLLTSADSAQCLLEVNPKRRRPTQPRAIKDYRRKYGRLNKPRKSLELPICEVKL